MIEGIPDFALWGGGLTGLTSFLLKKLIDHYFSKLKETKKLEADLLNQRIDFTFKKFEYDIDGLGSKLRLFEQKNESLSNNIAKFDLAIETLNLKLGGLKEDMNNFFKMFDQRVKELIRLENNKPITKGQ